jgi:hydrogenase maturation protease
VAKTDDPSSIDPLTAPAPRVLIAGIGNIFLGDDAFGCEVAQRLLQSESPAGVKIVDFGIRGLDLMYALSEPWDAAILIDAVPRGEAPGTLFLIEVGIADIAEAGRASPMLEAHSMNPLNVLRAAAAMGSLPNRIYIVGCQPSAVPEDDIQMEISEPVWRSLEPAMQMVQQIIRRLFAAPPDTIEPDSIEQSSPNISAAHR